MKAEKLPVHAVILAGGRGTRFWPRSRTRTPKQLLNIVGKGTMLEQTVARLRPLVSPDRIWTVTNAEQSAAVRKQLPSGARKRVLTEPFGRNTAAAIALAALHVRRAAKGDALIAVLPADHYIAQPDRYRKLVNAALALAREPGRMVVLGIPPTRPETGFGYIERLGEALNAGGFSAFAVKRFTEKPALELAKEYIASGNYHWNAGMFFWRVSTLVENLATFLPKTRVAFEELADFVGTRHYERNLRRIYAKLENISVDCAILEPATRQEGARSVFVIPADVGWSDIGSWAAVYELLQNAGATSDSSSAASGDANVFLSGGTAIDSQGNFVSVPGKFAALVGVRDLVVVETRDALLVVPRDRAQEVTNLVKWLEAKRLKHLL
ncbi:MAG TPA: sugar phosphate nucleotidyltransferase [Candidatus Acidoferrum sp.]|nr:sugar phosphate nucleotidyltransferase [Candidatus Acidoferrum sp.]